MNEVELLTRRLDRERNARRQAEVLLEQKSLELYQANQALQGANAELEQRVAARTAELSEANAQLQQDIIQRQRAEKALIAKELEARLLHRATTMAAETQSFETAMQQCLELVCDSTEWTLGHAYVVRGSGRNELVPTGIWHESRGRSHAAFREITEKTSFQSGVGLPGRVLASGEPAWIVDVQHDDNFTRAAACPDIGVKGAFAFPIKVAGQCVAVLEFFREEQAAEDKNFLQIIRSVGQQLGRVLERKRAEQALFDSERRFREMIDALPVAIYTTDGEGRLTHFNPAAVEFSGRVPELGTDHWCVSWKLYRPDGTLLPHDECPMACAIKQDRPVFGAEAIAERPDGKRIWFTPYPTPLRDNEGRVIGGINMLLDITDRKRAETEREELHRRLVDASRSAGMADVATGVLHNVGNVLNSVNVSASLATDRLRASKIANLGRAAAMLREHIAELPAFLTTDERGKQLPAYFIQLAEHLALEQSDVLRELESLERNVDHIKQVVSMQQSYARVAGVVERVTPAELLEDALRFNQAALSRHDILLEREYDDSAPPVETDKHKALQIIINLISNAKYAMDSVAPGRRRLTLRTRLLVGGRGRVRIEVTDNGMGIGVDNLSRIFSHGFTTRKDGHGFGLHSAALAAKELGGSLSVHSDGLGKGATFTLELPVAATGVAK